MGRGLRPTSGILPLLHHNPIHQLLPQAPEVFQGAGAVGEGGEDDAVLAVLLPDSGIGEAFGLQLAEVGLSFNDNNPTFTDPIVRILQQLLFKFIRQTAAPYVKTQLHRSRYFINMLATTALSTDKTELQLIQIKLKAGFDLN